MWPFSKKNPIEKVCERDSFPDLAKAVDNDKSNYETAVKYLKKKGNISLLLKIQTLRVAGDDLNSTLLSLNGNDSKVRTELNRLGNDGIAPVHLLSIIPGIEVCIRVLAHDLGNLDLKDSQGRTPILLAAEQGLTDTVLMLLNNGARDVDSADRTGWTPLHYACQLGRWQIVSLLLQAKAKVNPISKDGFMPIHVAASTMIASRQTSMSPAGLPWNPGDALQCVSLLVNNGADINHRCSQGFAAKDILSFSRQ